MKHILNHIWCFFFGHDFLTFNTSDNPCLTKRKCVRCGIRQVHINAYDQHGWYEDKE